MITAALAIIVIVACFAGFGIGVLFFGKTASAQDCSVAPETHDDCPSQKMGLCPVEDLSGTLSMAKSTRISYTKPKGL